VKLKNNGLEFALFEFLDSSSVKEWFRGWRPFPRSVKELFLALGETLEKNPLSKLRGFDKRGVVSSSTGRQTSSIGFKTKATSAWSSTGLSNQLRRVLFISHEISDSRNTISRLAASPGPAWFSQSGESADFIELPRSARPLDRGSLLCTNANALSIAGIVTRYTASYEINQSSESSAKRIDSRLLWNAARWHLTLRVLHSCRIDEKRSERDMRRESRSRGWKIDSCRTFLNGGKWEFSSPCRTTPLDLRLRAHFPSVTLAGDP